MSKYSGHIEVAETMLDAAEQLDEVMKDRMGNPVDGEVTYWALQLLIAKAQVHATLAVALKPDPPLDPPGV